MDLNTMLREAITTDSRKRKCRWQTELEAMGYKVIKDGCWKICNNNTNRYICLYYNDETIHTNNRNIRFGRMWSYKKHSYVTKPLEKINLEGLLNKNIKVETWGYRDGWTNVERMTDALYSKNIHQKALDNAWNEFQSNLDRITKEYNQKIADAKRSYEFDIEYHTRGLKTANNIINKLLKRG